ncbi:hypothetical protein SCH01S_01_00030 [Sphingomonas changbaiensis NBRC 104936]|uniref:Uncharacterized protein n=1 Tax=Sphingomonas changbaiensis NBRC 104936 TaxID=1219043 RepID=A0A0E9ML25_9SPHN|nr:hypothetical protein [Sphingomonas changbaiensis]GAO37840.1 hypothetical protein SCH01S_01_00030 [Sphingomonas changbaiensis NBRC 104936]
MKTCILLAALAAASATSAQVSSPETPAVPASAAPATRVTLPRDTPVELMAPREVSTADATAGEIFKLRVNKAIVIDGRTIVPAGTTAFGQVISASDSGGLGKSGRMTAKLLHIQLGETEIPLEGEMSAKGTGAGSAGLAVLFTGWAGFFHRGNNAKIKAGEILAGFVASDVVLDMSGPVPRRVEEPVSTVAPASTEAAAK